MANIFGKSAQQTWVDPATGVIYDAATMAPMSLAGENLGELSREPRSAPALNNSDADGFAALLGIAKEN